MITTEGWVEEHMSIFLNTFSIMNTSQGESWFYHVICLELRASVWRIQSSKTKCITSSFIIVPDFKLRKVEASAEQPQTAYGNKNPIEGPWPECVGQTGDWCTDYIASWLGYGALQNPGGRPKQVVNIITPYEYMESRVWIHADDNGNVLSIPERG